jgi:anti-anti-sigma factor
MTKPSETPAPLDIEIQKSEDRTLVALSGELDTATASHLYDALAELEAQGALHIVLDLARLTFMDSTGLGVIVTEHTRMKRAGGTITIFSPTSSVRRLFEISGLSQHLDIVPANGEA